MTLFFEPLIFYENELLGDISIGKILAHAQDIVQADIIINEIDEEVQFEFEKEFVKGEKKVFSFLYEKLEKEK